MKKFLILLIMLTILMSFPLRFFSAGFRYAFDVNFNTNEVHESYDDKKMWTLPLPPSTAFAYKHSDTAVTYYTKLAYEEFLLYYVEKNYEIQEDIVTYKGASFVMKEVHKDSEHKYYFIDIDLIKE